VGENWQLRRSTGQRGKAATTEKGTVEGRRRRAPYPPHSRARSSQLCATRAQKTRGARARAAGRALPVASLLPFYYFYFLLRHSFFSLLPSPLLFWSDEITPRVDDKHLLVQRVIEIETSSVKTSCPYYLFTPFTFYYVGPFFNPLHLHYCINVQTR